MKLQTRELFYQSPADGALALANTFYTTTDPLHKMRVRSVMTRSDTADSMDVSHSTDNGQTWSEPQSRETYKTTPTGVLRQYPQPGFVDPVTGQMLTIVMQANLPSDDPREGVKNWFLRYRISDDAGHSNKVDEQVIQQGDFTAEHPIDGIWVGKNCAMIGDLTCRPIRTRRGQILVPVQFTPIGPDGEYHNPGGGYTYHEAAVLIGTWTHDHRITWEISSRVANDPEKSTRGCVEPTLAEMPDGRILMAIRGSNDVKPHLPSYRWYAVSQDGGYTWTPPQPWTYTNGDNFFSPSSCSQLLQHSNGNTYWLGNICAHNAHGNAPRYPLVIGQVDPDSLLLMKDTLTAIDDREPDESDLMSLSNFMAHEDRQTHEIILHMSRGFTKTTRPSPTENPIYDFTANAYLYRIAP